MANFTISCFSILILSDRTGLKAEPHSPSASELQAASSHSAASLIQIRRLCGVFLPILFSSSLRYGRESLKKSSSILTRCRTFTSKQCNRWLSPLVRKSYLTFPTSTSAKEKNHATPAHTGDSPNFFFLAGHTSLHILEASTAKHDHKQHSTPHGQQGSP